MSENYNLNIDNNHLPIEPYMTVQSDLKEEITAIKWFWPYDKLINQTMVDKDILYYLPIEIRPATKGELTVNYQTVFDFFQNMDMIFYKEVYRNGTERIDICTPLAFITQFKPQEK